jgi:hypothetical protein
MPWQATQIPAASVSAMMAAQRPRPGVHLAATQNPVRFRAGGQQW